MAEILRKLNIYTPGFEAVIGISCVLINLYFSFRLNQLKTINSNLKIILVTCNITTALIAVFHSAILTPSDLYTLQDDNFFPKIMAIFVYLSLFLHNCCVFIINIKFILLGLERRYAFQQRAFYEHDRGRCAWRLLSFTVAFVVIASSIKVTAKYFTSTKQDIDVFMRSVFLLENSPNTIFVCTLLCGVGAIYGYYEFYQLNRTSASSRYNSRTLSESFQLKEVRTITKMVRPLLWLYIFGTILCLICFGFMVYAVYLLPTPDMELYMSMISMQNIIIGAYNIFSTIFMLLHFTRLKAVAFNDIMRVLCLKHRYNNRYEKQEVGAMHKDNDHFRSLQSMWEQRLQRKMF